MSTAVVASTATTSSSSSSSSSIQQTLSSNNGGGGGGASGDNMASAVAAAAAQTAPAATAAAATTTHGGGSGSGEDTRQQGKPLLAAANIGSSAAAAAQSSREESRSSNGPLATANSASSVPSNPLSETTASSSAAAAASAGAPDADATASATAAGATSAAAPSNKEGKEKELPIPQDLRKILTAVAQTGTCSWLPWTVKGSSADSAGVSAASHSAAAAATAATAPAHLKRPLPVSAAAAAAAAALQHHRPAGQQQQQQQHAKQHNHSSYRRFAASSPSGQPPRKKHRNGLKHSSMRCRFGDAAGGAGVVAGGGGGGRKRPLFLIRTSSSASTASSVFSPGSVGSGRTSGSEPEDTSQYDSEGTLSATSTSDLSFDRNLRTRVARSPFAPHATLPKPAEGHRVSSSFKCQKDAFRAALQLILDHFYKNRGGYKLSPAEKRRNSTLIAQCEESGKKDDSDPAERGNLNAAISAEAVFQQRRQRLLNFLEPSDKATKSSSSLPSQPPPDGPPFTIQRIAEVLVAPERYYTQTHKLCNCLEKLLLITSSANAFGGIFGGDTSQRRLEERELQALAEEQGRLQSELRQRRLRQRTSSSVLDNAADTAVDGSSGERHSGTGEHAKKDAHMEAAKGSEVGSVGNEQDMPSSEGSDAASRELLEAAARASLRTKFDHVGIDPHSAAVVNRDVRSIAESRGMTNSPPPPSLSMSAASPGIALSGHSGLLRHSHPSSPPGEEHPSVLTRVPSPILFNHGNERSSSPPMGPIHHANSTNMQLLHMHHNAAIPGVSHFELASLNHTSEGSSPSPAAPGLTSMTSKDVDLESRSSASSDVDSESDVSFDDSASDRSDGSDSGHLEPFSAARAMALNRMQQQRMQSRMLTSLHHSNQGEGFRPDSEYQSGDSVDSMKAEDSGGSDSSSSDMAD